MTEKVNKSRELDAFKAKLAHELIITPSIRG